MLQLECSCAEPLFSAAFLAVVQARRFLATGPLCLSCGCHPTAYGFDPRPFLLPGVDLIQQGRADVVGWAALQIYPAHGGQIHFVFSLRGNFVAHVTGGRLGRAWRVRCSV